MLLTTLAAGCGPLAGEPPAARDAAPAVAAPAGTELAPEVFAYAGEALWDGRPSLGGVWVAHPDVEAPSRVLIRDAGSQAEVTGALFRRERAFEGPPLQVSSAAAEALGLLPDEPAALEVTALRRLPDAEAEGPIEPADATPPLPEIEPDP